MKRHSKDVSHPLTVHACTHSGRHMHMQEISFLPDTSPEANCILEPFNLSANWVPGPRLTFPYGAILKWAKHGINLWLPNIVLRQGHSRFIAPVSTIRFTASENLPWQIHYRLYSVVWRVGGHSSLMLTHKCWCRCRPIFEVYYWLFGTSSQRVTHDIEESKVMLK